MAVGRDPKEANEELRRAASVRALRKVTNYLRMLSNAEKSGNIEEIVRLLNFAEPVRDLSKGLLEIVEDHEEEE